MSIKLIDMQKRPVQPQDPVVHHSHRKNILGGMVGNVLEWYDFAVFGYFAPVIGRHFYPSDNPTASLISAYGVFAIAYIMRPVGGALFGHIGDSMGRKKALQMSVMLMAIPTFLIGVLPTYAQIGFWAPLVLVLLRMLQGISVGGELIGSISFLAEIAPPEHRAKYGSWAECGSIGGIMLGSFVAMIMGALFDPLALETWGWRIPFLMGLLIGLVALWMRKNLEETEVFSQMENTQEIVKNPVKESLTRYPWTILHIAALVMLSGGGFYLLFVWWPTMLEELHQPPIANVMFGNTLAMLVLLLFIFIGGHLADVFGRQGLLATGAMGISVVAIPLFQMVETGGFYSAFLAQIIFAILLGLFLAPIPSTIADMIPAKYRYSGVAAGYNLSLAVFGGTAPLMATWLMVDVGGLHSAAFYLVFLSTSSLVATLALPKKFSEKSREPEYLWEQVLYKGILFSMQMSQRCQNKALKNYRKIFVLDDLK